MSSLSEMLAQLAYLSSGGGRESDSAQGGGIIKALSPIATGIAEAPGAALDRKIKEAQLAEAQQKIADAKLKSAPLYQSLNVPSAEVEDAAKKEFLARFNRPQTAGMGDEPALSRPAPQPTSPFVSQRETRAKEFGLPQAALDLNPGQLENIAQAKKNFTPASKKAWEQTIKDALPSMSIQDIEKTFGQGVSPESNFMAARQTAQLNQKKDAGGKMFPVASLSPDAQQAAIRGGLGSMVPESTARILNQGNLPKAATPEQLKDWASADTIRSEISDIRRLSDETNYSGIGIDKYYQNQLGQYSPIEALQTDPKITQLYRLINDVNNKMIYLQSGKQINESEFARLKSTFPEPQLNVPAFQERLNGFESVFNELSATMKANAAAAGYRGVPGQEKPKTVTPPPVAGNRDINFYISDFKRQFGDEAVPETRIRNRLKLLGIKDVSAQDKIISQLP